jgi:hypothetical protein
LGLAPDPNLRQSWFGGSAFATTASIPEALVNNASKLVHLALRTRKDRPAQTGQALGWLRDFIADS